ncbi:MAG: hypothetical protein ACREQA_21165 [Candidatus Binatia bacterium]
MGKTSRSAFGVFFFALAFFGEVTAQISSTAQREATRLERLANSAWEGMLEDVEFGYSWDRKALLDVFNFANGAHYLAQKLESGRTRPKEINGLVDMLLLQSQAVDRSLRSGRTGRSLLRDWDEAKTSLDSLARLVSVDQEPTSGRLDVARARENINNLRIEIKEVRHVGNVFGNDYRIRGAISGRNLVSAGIYHEGRLLKPVSVRLHERRFSENPFELRIEGPGGGVTLRVIDNQGFVLEQPIEFPAGGFRPGFK